MMPESMLLSCPQAPDLGAIFLVGNQVPRLLNTSSGARCKPKGLVGMKQILFRACRHHLDQQLNPPA
jgi:hypothetical protein